MIPKTFESKFYNAKNAKYGELITFTDEGEEKESSFKDEKTGQPRMQFIIGIRTENGDEQTLTMNGTSYRALADEYGEDTADWVNKQARVNIKNERIGKEFKDVIYL